MALKSMAEISRSSLEKLNLPDEARITDVNYLSSYNWIERPNPTIAVPGIPSLWNAPRSAQRLNKDSGYVYISQNAARHPESPLEPLFRALYITKPSFDIRSVDVVSDRNNIRKLLSFIDPTLNKNKNGIEPFAIQVEITKGTAIFCRQEAETKTFIGPNEFRGYGHEFEKAYTTNEISGSTAHHRIISYKFSDLHFILRHETDGYVAVDTPAPQQAHTTGNTDLSSLMGSLSISSTSKIQDTQPTESKLTIKEEGQEVPLESTLEIKTRTSSKPLPFAEIAPQLWVSQTPKLVRAYHNRGVFQRPDVEDVATDIRRWEQANQTALRKLAALIKTVINVADRAGGKAMVRYDDREDKLIIYGSERKELLPKDLYGKWAQANDPKAEPNTNTASGSATIPATKENDKNIVPSNEGEESKQRAEGPYSDIIDCATSDGLRQIFRRMPTRLSEYSKLCETLDSLEIDVLQGRKIREIMVVMKNGNDDWDPEERRKIEGLKSAARDSAFQLLYTFLRSSHGDVDKNMAYNATQFVVSHRRIFKHRTRKMVLEAFTHRFPPSVKQWKELNRWYVKNGALDGSQDEDATTEAEYFDSDSDISW
jgi:hypothetical protein